MIAENLTINCQNCAAWFTDDEVDQDSPCPKCGGELKNAHEWSFQTPWQMMIAEMYNAEIKRLEIRIYDLKNKLVNECWEE